MDLDNGMVVNMTDLKEVIKEAVLDPLDHKNLASGLSSRERECVWVCVWEKLVCRQGNERKKIRESKKVKTSNRWLLTSPCFFLLGPGCSFFQCSAEVCRSRTMDCLYHLPMAILTKKVISTTENLAVFIWKNFKYFFDQHPVLKHSQAQIYKVRLQETEHNVVEFMGESTRER